ncbi:MAG: hypothetical protein M3024_04015 [Candidatus Dormibacteraeota bacterium]|nr:hypothetical protein [Candidatus Dormibacteraeota bacterium]
MAPRPRVPEHVAAWNGLLEDQDLAAASAESLGQGQARRRLLFGGRPLSVSLRPNLLTPQRWAHAVQAARGVHSALMTLERELLRDPGLRTELALDPEEERLALADPGGRTASPSMRLDSFFGSEVRYVECNAESPAGMAYEDLVAEAFAELPVMRAFRRRYRVRSLPVRKRQLGAMLRSFREWGGDAKPAIAIVDWKGLPTATEFELFTAYFESQGVATVVCDPTELELRRRRLYAGGRPVSIVYKRVLTSELLARPEAAKALVDAYTSGAIVMVNTFRGKLLHVKLSLALLSDDLYAHLYTSRQREVIARHIPWTRRLREGPTTWRGRRVRDLVEHVRRRREQLALKPNDDYGGRGVVLGWTVSAEEWDRALAGALELPSVVQEAVEVPREPFPVLLDAIEIHDLAVDMDPYLFHGRPGGLLTRLSSSALLNVTAGTGSMVPTFLVEGRA